MPFDFIDLSDADDYFLFNEVTKDKESDIWGDDDNDDY